MTHTRLKIQSIGFRQTTQNNPCYQTAISKFWIFQNFENCKNKQQKIFFCIFFLKKSSFLKNRNICEIIIVGKYACQISKLYLWKITAGGHFESRKQPLFKAFLAIPIIFLFSSFVRFRFEKTCYRVIFRVRYENLIHKHALNHIKVENISLTFLDLVTLDDLDLT